MKIYTGILAIILIFLMVASVSAAINATSSGGGSTTLSPEDALAQVYVSSVTLDPQVFYPYEEGSITIQLSNSGSQSVALTHADLIDNKIHLKNQNAYQTQMYIGPGTTLTYTFLVTADPPAGTYFPLFTVASRDAGSIRYPIKVVVDSTDIRASISQKPDNFAVSKKDTVNVSIINPRNGDISSILVVPEGTGVDVSPAQAYINAVPARSSVEIPFQITPAQQTTVTFQVSFRNGNNIHTQEVVLPINIGLDKLAAVPIVNNIEVTSSGSYYKLTGDVNNAGITDAKSMILTVGAPARAVDPYPDYAIGTLASDDFSSFDLTFTSSDLSTVPLQIQWKDADGNTFTTTKNLDLRSSSASGTTGSSSSSSGSSGSSGSSAGTTRNSTGGPGGFGGPSGGGSIFGFGGSRGTGIAAFYPVIAGGIILIAGIVIYKKREWIAARVKKR